MRVVRDDPLRVLWLALVVATALSWGLSGDRSPAESDLLVTAVVAIGFLKAWAVGRWFMELHHARPLVRRAFDGWVAGSVIVVSVMQHVA